MNETTVETCIFRSKHRKRQCKRPGTEQGLCLEHDLTVERRRRHEPTVSGFALLGGLFVAAYAMLILYGILKGELL